MSNILNKIKEAAYNVVSVFKDTSSKMDKFKLSYYEDFRQGIFNRGWEKVCKGTSSWNVNAKPDDDLFEFTKDGLRLHAYKTLEGYRTCGIVSKMPLDFHKGRIEVVARMCNCPHSWHAIWLTGRNNAIIRDCAEIDISECFNAKPFTYQTVHSNAIHKKYGSGDTGRAFLKPEEWNTFACEIDDFSVRMFINGVKTKEYFNNGKSYPFGKAYNPMKVILSAQLGGSWPGWAKPDDILHGWIEIKSVKIYN